MSMNSGTKMPAFEFATLDTVLLYIHKLGQ